jgi:hypothetical protein
LPCSAMAAVVIVFLQPHDNRLSRMVSLKTTVSQFAIHSMNENDSERYELLD